ncbi:MAG TPA: hypothetical protein VIV06_09510, partial [Candidatus Limnocylindrales bacterium]
VFWAATLVERQAGVATADATLVGSAFLAGMVAGRLMLSSGRAAAANPHRLVAAGLVVAIGGALVVWGSALPLLSAAGLFCAGLGVAIQYPLGVAIALDASAGRLGQAGARLTIASGGAILGAPLALGALADTVGVVAGWALIVVLGLAGLLVASLVRTDARRRAAALPEAQAIAAD